MKRNTLKKKDKRKGKRQMKQVTYKKELVKKTGPGSWVRVQYLLNKEVIHADHYNLSNDREFIDHMINKTLVNIESNLKDLD